MNNLFNEIVAQHTAKLILNSAIGQASVPKAIASQSQLLRTIASGKIASAYLFTSTIEGVGKTKTALLFASYICSTTDMLKVHPQEENSTIGVEQVREIITFVSTSPIESNHKVVIIHDCDTITPTAANALLKTLEEPGKGIFILITSQAQNILPTIKSRCQIIPFAQLAIDEVKTILENQKIFLRQDILKLCSGSPGRAIAFQNLLNSIPESILDHTNVYLYCSHTTLIKHQPFPNYNYDKLWESIGSSPIDYKQIQYAYESIATDIRTRVIKSASNEWGKKLKQKPLENNQSTELNNSQLSLF
jgi:DNA polymerase-3 subunit delta'